VKATALLGVGGARLVGAVALIAALLVCTANSPGRHGGVGWAFTATDGKPVAVVRELSTLTAGAVLAGLMPDAAARQ
jgi:hypothetical protein